MYKCWFIFILSSAAIGAPIQHLTKIGEGEMHYLFWTLYRAELYAEAGRLAPDYHNTALKITYAKAIAKQDLLDATAEQWAYLGYPPQAITRWLTLLKPMWPNVSPNDELTLVIDNKGSSRFYIGNRLLGLIEERQFGSAFIAIWLSENTSEPALRRALLGHE